MYSCDDDKQLCGVHAETFKEGGHFPMQYILQSQRLERYLTSFVTISYGANIIAC
ncbi:hypothetical protein MN116_005005, partial [Schistosoma mekongi]